MRSPGLALALLLVACVDDTTVLGDGRAAQACAAAEQILAPPAGCTTVTVLSSDPYGCLRFDPSGGQVDTAGTWVRVAAAPGRAATVRVTLITSVPLCTLDVGLADGALADGGVPSCPGEVWMTTGGGTPCTCEPGTIASYGFDTSIAIPLGAREQQILLQPFGATFEVSVCDAGP